MRRRPVASDRASLVTPLAHPTGLRVSIPVVPPRPTPAPATRFALLIDALCRAIAAHGARHRRAGPVLLLLWPWLRRTAGRLARLAARIEAGRKPQARRRPAAPRPSQVSPKHRPRLPEGFAWVVRLVPEAASSASQLRHLLADPDMAALIEAAPTAGRLLRPLCRMLGVRPPPSLAPPSLAPPRPAALRPARAATAPTSDRPPSAPGPRPPVPWPRRAPPVAA